MGTGAIEDRKCDHGNPMPILGVSVAVTQLGFTFVPDEAKVTKWSRQIADALRCNRLTGGEASKLSGGFYVCFVYVHVSLYCVCVRAVLLLR